MLLIHRGSYRWLAAFAATCFVAGCSGGARQSASMPQLSPGAASMTITLKLPSKAPGDVARRPAYVSNGTQSMQATATQGSFTAQLIANCTTTCSGTMSVPTGLVTVAVTLYSMPNAMGSALSMGTVNVTVVVGPNNVNLTANPVVAGALVNVTPASVSLGTPSNVAVSVVALDPAGYTIVGPGSFVNPSGNPLTLTLSRVDTGGAATSFSTSTALTAPGQTATLAYNGAAFLNTVVSVTPSTAIPGPLSPASISFGFVYVSNRNTGAVLGFPLGGPYGNVAPTINISGSNVPLSDPVALAVDSAGGIYAVNDSGSGLSMWAAGTNGNVAPALT
ncbi:MAG: hypothetical protein JO359_11755, partial [Candidatus Eremiobacteraeota bacterium]|nr:hypothetical protein [Candidatus Eremiobacteraeota bacterium]